MPEHPGTGSAVLGFLQWCMAGVVAPIAGLGGEHTAVPMALIVLVLVAVSVAALFGLTREARGDRPRPQPPLTSRTLRTIERNLTMRAVTMYGPGDVRVVDRAEPAAHRADRRNDPVTADLRLRIRPVALPRHRARRAPTPMGHEYVGVVEQIGDRSRP